MEGIGGDSGGQEGWEGKDVGSRQHRNPPISNPKYLSGMYIDQATRIRDGQRKNTKPGNKRTTESDQYGIYNNNVRRHERKNRGRRMSERKGQ